MGVIDVVARTSGAATEVDLTQAASNYKTIWDQIVGIIAGNSILAIFLFGGLIAMCWRHFRKAKGAVRG